MTMRIAFALVALHSAATGALFAAGPEASKIFRKKCALCHDSKGQGKKEMAGTMAIAPESLDLTRADLLKKTDDELLHTLSVGKDKMPGFGTAYDEATLKTLVSHVRNLAKQAAPMPTPSAMPLPSASPSSTLPTTPQNP